MAISAGLGAFAQGAASGFVGRKKEMERQARIKADDELALRQIESMDRYSSVMSDMAKSGFGAAPPPGAPALSFGAAPISQVNSAGLGAAAFPASLIRTESGGNWHALNGEGYGGRLQFGTARLADAAKAGMVPAGTTGADFSKMSPQQQQRVEQWHFADIDRQAHARGLDRYIGQEIGGTTITQDAIRAMAHLGGIGGAEAYLKSGGRRNPHDSNNTSLASYARIHAGAPGATPRFIMGS